MKRDWELGLISLNNAGDKLGFFLSSAEMGQLIYLCISEVPRAGPPNGRAKILKGKVIMEQ